MQPGTDPEDINSILSRFHTWAEKKPATNGNGSAQGNGSSTEEVREVPYAEAMREHRSRHAPQNGPLKPAAPRRKAAHRQASPPLPGPVPNALTEEVAPPREKKPPFVPSLELLAALRSAAAAPAPRQAPSEPLQPVLFREESEPAKQARPASPPPSPSLSSTTLTQPPTPKNSARLPKAASASAFREALAGSAATVAPASVVAPHPRPNPKPPRQQNAAASTQRSPAPTQQPAQVKASIAARSRQPAKPAQLVIRAKPVTAGSRRTISKAVTPRRTAAPVTAKRPKPRPAPFRQVLTNTIQQPRLPDTPAKKGMPDRTRRITTRFTTAEERRIEKQASLLGLTVSAYLRHCALATVTPPAEPVPPPAMLAARNKVPHRTAQNPYPPNPYAAQGSSLIGGWLALLRNRFLGPPIQFSDDA